MSKSDTLHRNHRRKGVFMKRIISMLLVCILLLQVVPMSGFAVDWENRTFSSFEELKELCAKTYDTKTYFYYHGTEDLVISQDLTLPDNTVFDAMEATVIIPSGVTFRSGVSAFAKDWVIQGTAYLHHTKIFGSMTVTGKVYASGGFEVEDNAAALDENIDNIIVGLNNITLNGWRITLRPHVYTMEELKAFVKKAGTLDPVFEYCLFLQDDFVIDQSITIPENCSLSGNNATSITVAKGCTLTLNGRYAVAPPTTTINGSLVNNGGINLWTDETLIIASGGSYSGKGYIFLQPNCDPSDYIKGVNLDDFSIEKLNTGASYLYYTAGIPRLPKPTSLKWGKLENYSVWSNSAGGYVKKDITTPGAIYFKHNNSNNVPFRITVYDSEDTMMGYVTYRSGSNGDYISVPNFIFSDHDSGSYYYTVTALGDNKTYRDSETVKSPIYKYTRPSKQVGSCTGVSWEQDCYPSFSAPSSTTYVGGYEIEVYYSATETGTKECCSRQYFYGTKEIPDIQLLNYSWVDGMGPGYFFYRVRAISSDITVRASGSWSEMSNSIYLEPLNVKASNVASSGKIKITWDEVRGAAEYQVYRATSQNGSYERVKTTTGTSYTNTSAKAGTTYYYKVRAVTKSGVKMPFSSVVSRRCDLPQPVAKAATLSSNGKIKISWEKIDGAKEYKVYRATSEDGEYTLMKTTTGTSYTNTSAKAGTTYYYKVKAIHSKSDANSVYSEVVSKTAKLGRPDVTATNIASSGKIKLTWDAISDALEYYVYRATSEKGEYELVGSTVDTSYTDADATAGKKFYYKVKAIHSDSSCNSSYSEADGRYCDLVRPDVSISLKSGKPRITWDEISGAKEYKVYRATSKNGEYKLIKTTTGTSFTNTSATAGKTYYYKVKAIHSNSSANSAYSSVKSIKSK